MTNEEYKEIAASFNDDEASIENGAKLFEIGATIRAAVRMRNLADNDTELWNYFEWERQSLVLYSNAALAYGLCTCNGVVIALMDGRLKCITCGEIHKHVDA